MPHIKSTEVFTFEELSESAKDKAREWYRIGNLDYDWWDYGDMKNCADILGITLDTKGKHSVAIFFSGFYSQGDGACFEGKYAYSKGASKMIREYAPYDAELARIADKLQDVQRRNFYRITAEMRQGRMSHYNHSGTMSVEVDGTATDCEDDIVQCMRDFADWIYSQLEKEYEYLNSEEVVDESILCNGYEFDEYGSIA